MPKKLPQNVVMNNENDQKYYDALCEIEDFDINDVRTHKVTGIGIEKYFLCCHSLDYFAMTARTSLWRIMRYFFPSNSSSVPEYLPYRTQSPFFRTISSSLVPLPAAMTSPFRGFSFAVSGMMIPPIVFSSASAGRIRTLPAACCDVVGMKAPSLI